MTGQAKGVILFATTGYELAFTSLLFNEHFFEKYAIVLIVNVIIALIARFIITTELSRVLMGIGGVLFIIQLVGALRNLAVVTFALFIISHVDILQILFFKKGYGGTND